VLSRQMDYIFRAIKCNNRITGFTGFTGFTGLQDRQIESVMENYNVNVS
jgi:hypothetical protein